MKEILFKWPDELETSDSSPLHTAYRLFRSQSFNTSESILLTYIASSDFSPDSFFLLSLLRLRSFNYNSFNHLIRESLPSDLDTCELLFLQAQYLLQRSEITKLSPLSSSIKSQIDLFPPLGLSLAAFYIHVGKLQEAFDLLLSLPVFYRNSLEGLRLNCRIFERSGDFQSSLNIMRDVCDRFTNHLPSNTPLDVAIKALSGSYSSYP